MRLSKVFHAVKTGSAEEKVAFWQLCKTAASAKGEHVAIGLTKIALDIWADSYESGHNPGADRTTREAFAGSFGSAAAAEQEFSKWAADGQISEDEHAKLSTWLAEGAVNDLVQMTKSAGGMDLIRNPRVIGSIAGTALGAGLGAWQDDNDRARGALMGALPGALAGLAVGHGIGAYQTDRALATAARAFQAEAQRGRGQGVADAYQRVASIWNDPSLTSHIEQNASRIAEHYAAGHTHLPEFMHDVLKSGQERNVFMQAVQRFMPKSPKTASVRSKLADIMQGLDQGGQPPMNADMPEAAPQGSPEGEAIASPDPGQSEAMEDVDRAHKVVDNMIFLAKQVQLPALAQEMEQNRESLAGHFADGNAYLPPELQHHFAQSEHAEAFMKKYKQRFGAPNVSGGKKTAGFMENMKQHVDSFRGLAPGGVDMEEVRKYLPDAQYAGMVPMGPKRQPGIVSQGGSAMMTWDPEQVRHQRSADPRGFYQGFSRPQAPPAAYQAYQQLAGAEGAPKTAGNAYWSIPAEGEIPNLHLTDEQLQKLTPGHARHLLGQPIDYSPESYEKLHALSQKTASDQDAWLSWRTHR